MKFGSSCYFLPGNVKGLIESYRWTNRITRNDSEEEREGNPAAESAPHYPADVFNPSVRSTTVPPEVSTGWYCRYNWGISFATLIDKVPSGDAASTDAKVSAESSTPSSVASTPPLSLFALCFSSSLASRARCTYDLPRPRRDESALYGTLEDEDASKFHEDEPTLIRYRFTLHPIDYLSPRYLRRDPDDGSVRNICILFVRPKNENLPRRRTRS